MAYPHKAWKRPTQSMNLSPYNFRKRYFQIEDMAKEKFWSIYGVYVKKFLQSHIINLKIATDKVIRGQVSYILNSCAIFKIWLNHFEHISRYWPARKRKRITRGRT